MYRHKPLTFRRANAMKGRVLSQGKKILHEKRTMGRLARRLEGSWVDVSFGPFLLIPFSQFAHGCHVGDAGPRQPKVEADRTHATKTWREIVS